MDRRDFVQLTTCALLAGGTGACASMALVRVPSDGGLARVVVRNHPQLGAPGGFIRVQPDSLPHYLLVLAEQDGRFGVLSPVCTHRQCIVDVAGPRLVCPCHGSEYDRGGQVTNGPAEEPLTRYPAEVNSAGELVIRLEAS
jgi:cytochrome b6-f complex iron-sulfur subunit